MNVCLKKHNDRDTINKSHVYTLSQRHHSMMIDLYSIEEESSYVVNQSHDEAMSLNQLYPLI